MPARRRRNVGEYTIEITPTVLSDAASDIAEAMDNYIGNALLDEGVLIPESPQWSRWKKEFHQETLRLLRAYFGK